MIALTYFKTIFITNYKDLKCYYNKLITYITGASYTGIVTHRVLKLLSCDLCMKIVSWYVSCDNYRNMYRIVRWLYHYSPSFNIIQVILRWQKDNNERLWAMKHHTVISWILPQARFEPRTLWYEVRNTNHLATLILPFAGESICISTGCLPSKKVGVHQSAQHDPNSVNWALKLNFKQQTRKTNLAN